MRTALVVVALAATLPSQETKDAMRLLGDSARMYQDIGSYESSAIARRSLPGDLTGQVQLKFAYASSKMTPADLPVPMLPQSIQMRQVEIFDRQSKPVKKDLPFRGPGPAFSFDEIAWRVTNAEITGTEIVHAHPCEILDVQYENTHRNPKGAPVRYWIEPATKIIWKMQFSEPDFLSKTGDLARWTVLWDSWTKDEAPPAWLIRLSSNMIATEQTALLGREAPEVRGESLGGEPFQLSRLKGTTVVLDFWTTWCGPCSEEMASLERLKASLSDKRIEILGITEENRENATRWLEERRRTLPTAVVPRDTAFRAYRVDNLPQIVVINREGIVAHHWVGLTNEKDLQRAVQMLLGQ